MKGKKNYSWSLVDDEQLIGESHGQRMMRTVQANAKATKSAVKIGKVLKCTMQFQF